MLDKLIALTRACRFLLSEALPNQNADAVREILDNATPIANDLAGELNRATRCNISIDEWGVSEPNAHFAVLQLARVFLSIDSPGQKLFLDDILVVRCELDSLVRKEHSYIAERSSTPGSKPGSRKKTVPQNPNVLKLAREVKRRRIEADKNGWTVPTNLEISREFFDDEATAKATAEELKPSRFGWLLDP